MEKKITIGTFECADEDIMAVVRAMQSGMLSTGKELKEFESKVSFYHGHRHGIMVNSGQSALEVALVLAKVALKKTSLKVVVPATTYAATLWAILNTDNEPIFCDIGDDYNIDYSQLSKDLEADVILPVDLCGKTTRPPDWVLDKYFIIEDACEAFGNKEANYGDITCFSFYVSHIITTGSGGMLCLDRDDLDEYARSYITHGRTFGGDFTKYNDQWVNRFLFDKVGVSYRSDNLSAALGLSQFNRVDSVIERRRENARVLLSDWDSWSSLNRNYIYPSRSYHENCVYQFFPIMINRPDMDRGDLLRFLFEKGIDTRVLLNLTDQPIVETLYGDKLKHKFKNAHFANERGFIVGCHQDLDRKDMIYISECLHLYVKER